MLEVGASHGFSVTDGGTFRTYKYKVISKLNGKQGQDFDSTDMSVPCKLGLQLEIGMGVHPSTPVNRIGGARTRIRQPETRRYTRVRQWTRPAGRVRYGSGYTKHSS